MVIGNCALLMLFLSFYHLILRVEFYDNNSIPPLKYGIYTKNSPAANGEFFCVVVLYPPVALSNKFFCLRGIYNGNENLYGGVRLL